MIKRISILLIVIFIVGTPITERAASRKPVRARHGMVASTSEVASRIGVEIMQRGGNAADAAIAAAAVNVVTKPHRTHLGGDAFMLVWRKKLNVVDCLNAGGRAPLKATPESFGDHIPATGSQASTVPGLVDAIRYVDRIG